MFFSQKRPGKRVYQIVASDILRLVSKSIGITNLFKMKILRKQKLSFKSNDLFFCF